MAKQVDNTNIGTLLEALITKIKSFFWRKDETSELPIDNTPTSGSNNLVKSGGVYSALAAKYTKPSGGIPASDLASGVIPDVSQFITRSVNDLANYYLKSETYTQTEVNNLIGAIQQFHYEIAASTSAVTNPQSNVLYLIGPTGSGADKYEEYVYSSGWVKIGDTSIDLSGYVTIQALNTALSAYTTTNDLTTLLAGKQDTIDAQHKLDYSLLSNTPTIPTDVVKYASQSLTDAQKSQARTNIGAGTYSKPANGIPASDLADGVIPTIPTDMVKYTEQTLTDAQKAQARTNIGAGSYSKPSGGIPASDIASGVIPAAPVNADWNASSGLAQILNKPTIPAAQVNSDWNATSGLAQILNKPTIPAAQVNADWNADSGVAQILNKPTIPVNYAGSQTPGGPANKALSIPFGEVDADSTATKIKATVNNFPSTLENGVFAYIRNNAVASASGWTLNINGTGAKPVYASNADATRTSTIFSASVTYLFIYNSTRVEGGCWDMYYGYNANDNTIGYSLRTNKMSLPTTSACYRYRLLFTSADGTHFVPANASSSTNATATRTTTQTPIDPFGNILYYGYTTAVTSGNRPGVTYLWEQYELTLGYSFNRTGAALTLTSWKPVYIKCAPQTDGSAIIDADNPYVQDLPATADGKIYIYLGVATSATQVEMVFHHPVYYNDGTSIRLWTNAAASVSAGTLDTTATTSQTTSASEALSGNVVLHKVSKTGSYDDLLDKPTIPVVSGITNAEIDTIMAS